MYGTTASARVRRAMGRDESVRTNGARAGRAAG
jgi:hypothetical protein